jgi:CCR4-NOT transcription complex subunit 7/8
VWASNLEEEFARLREIVKKYPYVAMDTEFPGIVAKPIGDFRSASDYQYQLLQTNVNLLKLIQLGITFYNNEGERPPGISTFQFNFKFCLSEDMYAQDSIDMLTQAGIQFKLHEEEGIEMSNFAELLTSSGLVLREEISWITFASGYDFGYLMRVLTCQKLPEEESDFFDLMSYFFPKVYDVKYLMKSCKNLKGGLQEVADSLKLERVGKQHQAGSDSFLTGAAFFKMKQVFFDDHINEETYCGNVFGLGNSYSGNGYTITDGSQ